MTVQAAHLVEAGHIASRDLRSALDSIVEPDPVAEKGAKLPSQRPGKGQTFELMALFASLDGEAFRSLDDKALVCLTDKGRRKTLSLAQAIRLLCLAYYRQTGLPVSARSKEDVQSLLSAMADDRPKRKTWIRVAEHDGDLYLDLGDDDWSVVQITPHGWSVVDFSPVHFLRPSAMFPLPVPVRGGNLAELFELVNIPDRPSQALALAWVIAAFRPDRPMPLLAVHGKQGCAKSTTAKILTSLLDPKQTSLRTRPKDEQTVMVSAMNAWVLAYDNLSSIPEWLSDLLCCLSTGASHPTRTLYTETGETVMQALRPVVLTSIVDVAKRSDLIDRAVMLNLPTIAEESRRSEEEVWADFLAAHARILGAMLDAVSSAILKLPDVKAKVLPRMADFAKWAMAAEEGLGLEEGEFMAAYSENRLDFHAQALESCPLFEPLDRFMSQKSEWTGTSSDLLDEIERNATKAQRENRRWPKDPTRLSGEIQRIAPNLKMAGFEVQQFRESTKQRRRLIQIIKCTEDGIGKRLQPRDQEQAQLVD